MAASTVTIEEVKSRKQRRRFLDFPFELYEGNPYWVPELLTADIQALWKNPALEFCKTRYFLASQNGSLHRNFMGYTPLYTRLSLALGASSISDTWTAFVQNEKAGHFRPAAPRRETVGVDRHRRIGAVDYFLIDGDHVVAVDRHGDFKALALTVVPAQGDRAVRG